MNGWFPRLRADGTIRSGNSGIWEKTLNGSPVQVSPVGIGPIWSGQVSVFNLNNNTTQYTPDKILPIAYNDYYGSDIGQWTGWLPGEGRIDRYVGSNLVQQIPGGCLGKFAGASFGYLTPFQSVPPLYIRSLVINGIVMPTGQKAITNWTPDKNSGFYVYTVATGTYTKQIFDYEGNNVTIRSQQDEEPIVLFTKNYEYPWMLSGIGEVTVVRMIRSAFGYVIKGNLKNPDARMINNQLFVVGSDEAVLREIWIDFSQPMQDLRLL